MINYFLESKHARLTQNHIKSNELYNKILNHNGKTAFCCYFDLDESLLKLEWDTGKLDREGKKIYEYHLPENNQNKNSYICNGKTFTQYEGTCSPALGCVSFDFDSETPADSLDDVKKFLEWLDIKNTAVFFSGSKGFHVMIPFEYFNLEPNIFLHNQLKDLAKYLKEFYPTLDDSIYNYNRKFRVPFSQHDKSDLYKNFVEYDYLYSCEIEDIINDAHEPNKFDFLKELNFDVKTLQVLDDAINNSKRKTYEIEKERAGTVDKPSPFEKFDGKICITKMLESRCDDVGRNNACIRLVNDYFRTGKTQSKCETDVFSWSQENGLPLSEVSMIISNIYERGGNYNFGCQDECKSIYCSAKCPIWKKLAPDKRPMTVDMSEKDMQSTDSKKMKDEFEGVRWLMGSIFGSNWLEEKGVFEVGSIIKQDARRLFYYKKKHWQLLDESKIQVLKTRLNSKYENKLTKRKLDSVFELFIMYVPEKPDDVDLFAPGNDMANFLDGTLHLERKVGGEYELDFREHDKFDFCTTIIDQKYSRYLKDPERKNSMFTDWLLEYLNGDEEQFLLIQEMFGASLMPKFPQFFVLIGKSSTGKSTTIKILKQLHSNENNISGVSPDKFHGFHMASMIGKLINIVGDIKTNCRIDDDIVKQVDDQEVVRIEIKKKDDVYTRLPALHIFGANKMPSTSEGYSGAMKRRFSIINFDKQYTGAKNSEIAKDMFENDPSGILAFALNGLKRLVEDNRGEYTKTAKSQENVEKWSKKTDCLQQFLGELMEDPFELDGKSYQLYYDENQKVNRALLWNLFREWQNEAIEQRNWIAKMAFFNALSDSGYSYKRFSHGRYILGIGEIIPTQNDTI